MRFDRVGATAQDLWIMAETSLTAIERQLDVLKPDILVVDSIQTLYSDEVQASPGSVSQLRAITARLMAIAKGKDIATFVIGHVTKEGAIAGPRVLEHMVDTVLYLQGQRGHHFAFCGLSRIALVPPMRSALSRCAVRD